MRKGDCGKEIVLFLLEDFVGKGDAGGDHFDDVATDDPFGKLGIFQLFAHRNAISGSEKLWKVRFERMMRKSGKRNLAGRAVAPFGECDSQDFRGGLRVLFECLEEVPHPEEQYRVRILCLHLGILFHEGRRHREIKLNPPRKSIQPKDCHRCTQMKTKWLKKTSAPLSG